MYINMNQEHLIQIQRYENIVRDIENNLKERTTF